ncbi:MAG: hypothetical protein ACPG5B_12395 [Chitinophagales bacterium]
MRNILTIVNNLTKEEKRYFRLYLLRVKGKNQSGKKISELFDAVESKKFLSEQALAEHFYPKTKNKNAYYRLKNRFFDDLEQSLLMQHSSFDERMEIIKQISIARIYAQKSLYSEAFSALAKAEKKAEKLDYFDILSVIYREIVGICFYYPTANIQEYLEKQAKNVQKYQEWLKYDQIVQYIKYRFKQTNYDLRDNSLVDALQDIQNSFGVEEMVLKSPKIRFTIDDCVKQALLQKKDFKQLETYLLKTYETFTKDELYTQASHEKLIHTLVWIINTLFKNCKFEKTLIYTQKLHDALEQYNQVYYEKYIWTYYQCQVTQFFYSNQCEKAVNLLQNLIKKGLPKGILYYDLFVHLNLSVVYYCMNNVDKALSYLSVLFVNETYKKLSPQLQLRLALVEIILHFEHEDFLFIDYKITETRRLFKKMLAKPDYIREKNFLKIIKKGINKLKPFQNTLVVKAAKAFIENSPKYEPVSNESISYRVWLEAKMNKKTYYEMIFKNIEKL